LAWNESVYFKDDEKLFDLLGIPTKAGTTTIDATPNYPWKKIGVDLCVFEKESYLIICDYYSNFPEVCKLKSISSNSVIKITKYVSNSMEFVKSVSPRMVPSLVIRNSKTFVNKYQFKHTTSSPKYP